MDETVEYPNGSRDGDSGTGPGSRFSPGLVVLCFAAAVFFGCILSPPALMDDVDSVQAQIAHNMLSSHDWVIAHLDGVPYLEKSPLIYWSIATSFKVLGVHDWVARIPVAFAAVLLAWFTWHYARWAFGIRAGFYAGIVISTCIGLFLFTRIQIPDVMLTLVVAIAFFAFQRATDDDETHPRRWAAVLAASLGVGLLLKSLISMVVPIGGILVYLAVTRQLFSRKIWCRLHVLSGALIVLLIAAPWHLLATLRMPPYLNFTLHSASGEYHGFFWFYFINEQLLRFLNLRYPRDYNTVPRFAFWALHLVWLFPWSVYFPAALRLNYKPLDRAGRTRLLALCWTGFLLVFFTFSTTQEYYSMPIYPALAMLLCCAIAEDDRWAKWGTKFLGAVLALSAIAVASILFLVGNMSAPGDISRALQQHPEAYTLSLGHMGDLTLASFAYLKLPLFVSLVAFLIGVVATFFLRGRRAYLSIALAMVVFIHAARLALVVFDPYLSSRPLAEALLRAPEGQLIINGQYYAFSSVFFYTNRSALLWNGRVNNLEYGSYAPGSPSVFIGDHEFLARWSSPDRFYVLSDGDGISHLQSLVDSAHLHLILESGGKTLYSNQP
jgi:4-amino-4-deoxy-L-arabinose transferase-like glycosyltransferase